MTPDELGLFYGVALTAGAILSGFIGTFLNFRIQREANYYRQPVLDFNGDKPEGRGKDARIGLSHFTSSFLLLILSAVCSTICGVFWPLLALARWRPAQTGPAPIVAGLGSSVILLAAYFFDELIHYKILKWNLANDLREWKNELVVLVVGVLLAALFIYVVCLALWT
jgi:hypothetical protein